MSILNTFNFKNSDRVVQLIWINVIAFLLVAIPSVLFKLTQTAVWWEPNQWLGVPASIPILITKPWTLFTYMFMHNGLFHILFNMLWLYWLGQIFAEYLGQAKLTAVYILGGISGALVYILAYNVFPFFSTLKESSYAIGASASVIAIVAATATLLPDYKIRMLFFGDVSLKYLALAMVAIDLISSSSENAGGHIAHIGGAIFGFAYIKLLRSGTNMGKFVEAYFIPKTDSKKGKVIKMTPKPTPTSTVPDRPSQKQIDNILDKISKTGYDTLTQTEKDMLFKAGK